MVFPFGKPHELLRTGKYLLRRQYRLLDMLQGGYLSTTTHELSGTKLSMCVCALHLLAFFLILASFRESLYIVAEVPSCLI